MKNLTFITGNLNKVKQLRDYLNHPIEHLALDLDEIQSLDTEVIIEYKVKQAFAKIKTPVLVDDASLIINSWGKLPGPFVKYFNTEIGPEKICEMMAGFESKSAVAAVMIGFFDGTDVKIFKGEVRGRIADKPGEDKNVGFGYDFYFIPDGYEQARSAMSQTDYDATSPRKIALEQLADFLGT